MSLLGLLALVFVFVVFVPIVTTATASEESQDPRGLIESLEELLALDRDNQKKLKHNYGKQEEGGGIHPQLMLSILLHSPTSYISLMGHQGECAFYAMLENGLLKSARDQDPSHRPIAVPIPKKCFNNKDLAQLFDPLHIEKTIKALPFPLPKTKKECREIVEGWRKNPYTPHLCSIPKILNRGKRMEKLLLQKRAGSPSRRLFYQKMVDKRDRIKNKISFFHSTYLDNLCKNLATPEKFCQTYLSPDIWSKIIHGEFPEYLMSYRCASMRESPLHSCATRLKQNPEICRTSVSPGRLALFPRPDCQHISTALKVSHLITDYHDCPAHVSNTSITNAYRLSKHLKKKKGGKVPNGPFKTETCAFEAHFALARLSLERDRESWPLNICYRDLIRKRKKCHPFIPGHDKKNPLAETRVVANILRKIKGAPRKMLCKIINRREYNPHRLGFKGGCLIVYEKKNCPSTDCPKSIIYRDKEIEEITYRGALSFDYFPNSYQHTKTSVSALLEESYKVKSKSIEDLSQLRYLLNRGHVAHGVGCLEDILPTRFKKWALNDCRPIPFIVDGFTVQQGGTLLAIRTALDDIHSPRLIPWNALHMALASYSKLHPLNSWTFRGIE